MFLPGFCLPEEQQRVWDEEQKQKAGTSVTVKGDASATTASSLEEVLGDVTSDGAHLFFLRSKWRAPISESVLVRSKARLEAVSYMVRAVQALLTAKIMQCNF